MGLLKDMWNFEKFLPKSIKIYEDKARGIEHVEIINPPSIYGAEKVSWHIDKQKGITVVDIGSLDEHKQIGGDEKSLASLA